MVHLENNYLFGQLPDEFGQSKNLADLSLSGNSISGPIPISIGRLSSLTTLDISYNQLNGTLPENLGQLVKLEISDGSVHPFQLGYLSLTFWQLGTQSVAGNVTRIGASQHRNFRFHSNLVLAQMFPIIFLNISRNQIRGDIPSIHEVFAPYSMIDLSSNSFKGPLPLIPSNVIHLDLSTNSFSESIYHALCGRVENSNTLSGLSLGSSNLLGRIPDCWKHWQYLKILKLENNNLIGTIPHSIGNLTSLKSLHLRHNKPSGELPQSLQHCTNWGSLILMDMNLLEAYQLGWGIHFCN
ncbi:hypothetical protein ACSBR1_008085 [Camellia fascicularis]